MAITASQAQGLVLALFGASAGGHLTGLTAASSLSGLAADLSTSAGLILDRDLSSNTTFRDLVLTTNLKLTGTALTEAQKWMDGEFSKGSARADILAAAVTFLDGLTDTTNAFYATAAAYRTTVTNAVTWSQGAGATVTSVATLMAQQGTSSNVTGQTFTLTAGSTADLISGTAGNDTITGTAATLGSSDVIVDTSTVDSDVLTMTGQTADVANSTVIAGVETLNFNTTIVSGSTFTVNADKITGAKTINVARGDLTLAGANINGKGAVTVAGMNGSGVTLNATGLSTAATTVTQVTAAGATVTTDGSGNATLNGVGTLNAANAGASATVAVDGTSTAALATGNVVIKADKAGTVTAGNTNAIVGNISIDAAAAISVTAKIGTNGGAATVNAATAAAAGSTIALAVEGINANGATISTGTSGSLNAGGDIYTGTITNKNTITIDGTSGTTDAATVKAGGYVALSNGASQAVEALTLSGNGAAVTYSVSGTNAATSYTKAGTDSVTLIANSSYLGGKTVTGIDNVVINGHTGGNARDLSKVAAPIYINADIANDALTVASGANVTLGKDQTTGTKIYSKTDKGSLNLVMGDDTADTSTATIAAAAVTLGTTAGTFATVSIDATAGAFSATTFDATGGVATNKPAVTIKGTKAVTITGAYATTTNSAVASTIKADSIDASAVTGVVTMNIGAGTANVTTGSGADVLVVDDRSVTGTVGVDANFDADGTGTSNTISYVVNAGAGANTVTLTSYKSGSQFLTGDGIDTVNVNDASSAVIVTGAGADTINIGASTDSDAVIVAGDGVDTLVFKSTSGNDFGDSANPNFGFTGVEYVDVSALTSGTDSINSAQLAANPTFTLVGTSGGADTLTVVGKSSTAANTIDASGITLSNATVILTGNKNVDTITGTTGNDYINATIGADVINGGTGTDTVNYGNVTVNGTISTEADRLTYGDATNGSGVAIQGVVVNLGPSTSSITAADVFSATGKYLSNGVASVAGGKTGWTFSTQSANNSANQQTLTSIEKVIGTAGNDYIAAADAGSTIQGGAGDDYIKLAGGTDTVILSASGSQGKDTVVSFTQGTDKLNVVAMAAGSITAATLINAAATVDTTANRKDFLQAFTTADGATLKTGGAVTIAAADLTATTLTNVAAWIAERFTGNSSTATADTGIYVINWTETGTTKSYVYQWDNDTTANVTQAAELKLVGFIDRGATALANTDFVIS